MRAKLQKGMRVRVCWHDAEADTGWEALDETKFKNPAAVESIGRVELINQHTLVLSGDQDQENGHINRTMRIPRHTILAIHKLNLGNQVAL